MSMVHKIQRKKQKSEMTAQQYFIQQDLQEMEYQKETDQLSKKANRSSRKEASSASLSCKENVLMDPYSSSCIALGNIMLPPPTMKVTPFVSDCSLPSRCCSLMNTASGSSQDTHHQQHPVLSYHEINGKETDKRSINKMPRDAVIMLTSIDLSVLENIYWDNDALHDIMDDKPCLSGAGVENGDVRRSIIPIVSSQYSTTVSSAASSSLSLLVDNVTGSTDDNGNDFDDEVNECSSVATIDDYFDLAMMEQYNSSNNLSSSFSLLEEERGNWDPFHDVFSSGSSAIGRQQQWYSYYDNVNRLICKADGQRTRP